MKLGQNVVCLCFVCWKVSKQEKVSGNTFFWFFPVFPSVFNLIRICRPKLTFRTRFKKFGPIHEYWDHKKAMLNGKYGPKVKNGIFCTKKCRFFILAPNPKTKAISQHKTLRAFGIWSRICNILPKGAPRMAKRHF